MQPYGGFWIRVVAYIIDAIILNIVIGILGAILGVGIGAQSLMMNADPADTQMWSGALGGLLGLFGTWLYFAILESSPWQGTVGKKALGLVVTDRGGARISFARATGRYFAKFLSGMILGFGFFMVGWTAYKQGLHDILAGTLVYKRDFAPAGLNLATFE